MAKDSETTIELWVHCSECKHSWIVAYLPMRAERVGDLTNKAACPKCDHSTKLYIGKSDETEAAEIAEAALENDAQRNSPEGMRRRIIP